MVHWLWLAASCPGSPTHIVVPFFEAKFGFIVNTVVRTVVFCRIGSSVRSCDKVLRWNFLIGFLENGVSSPRMASPKKVFWASSCLSRLFLLFKVAGSE